MVSCGEWRRGEGREEQACRRRRWQGWTCTRTSMPIQASAHSARATDRCPEPRFVASVCRNTSGHRVSLRCARARLWANWVWTAPWGRLWPRWISEGRTQGISAARSELLQMRILSFLSACIWARGRDRLCGPVLPASCSRRSTRRWKAWLSISRSQGER